MNGKFLLDTNIVVALFKDDTAVHELRIKTMSWNPQFVHTKMLVISAGIVILFLWMFYRMLNP